MKLTSGQIHEAVIEVIGTIFDAFEVPVDVPVVLVERLETTSVPSSNILMTFQLDGLRFMDIDLISCMLNQISSEIRLLPSSDFSTLKVIFEGVEDSQIFSALALCSSDSFTHHESRLTNSEADED